MFKDLNAYDEAIEKTLLLKKYATARYMTQDLLIISIDSKELYLKKYIKIQYLLSLNFTRYLYDIIIVLCLLVTT